MRRYAIGSVILVSVFALFAHADRLPHPPGPAYGGFIPGNMTHRAADSTEADCN